MTRYRDIITGTASILISIFLYILTFSVKDFSNVRIGPDFVPKLVALFIGILGVVILFQGLHKLKTNPEAQPAEPVTTRKHAVLLSFLLLFAYIALLEMIGFMIMTTIYLFLQIMVLAPANRRRYAIFGLISVLTSVVSYYLFVGFFHVMIPAGILG